MTRPAALTYVVVATGQILDTVTLVDGHLHFASGDAADVFPAQQARFGWDDEQVFDELDGWSNGYMALKPA